MLSHKNDENVKNELSRIIKNDGKIEIEQIKNLIEFLTKTLDNEVVLSFISDVKQKINEKYANIFSDELLCLVDKITHYSEHKGGDSYLYSECQYSEEYCYKIGELEFSFSSYNTRKTFFRVLKISGQDCNLSFEYDAFPYIVANYIEKEEINPDFYDEHKNKDKNIRKMTNMSDKIQKILGIQELVSPYKLTLFILAVFYRTDFDLMNHFGFDKLKDC